MMMLVMMAMMAMMINEKEEREPSILRLSRSRLVCHSIGYWPACLIDDGQGKKAGESSKLLYI
jgi:hypothetical protein